MSTVAEQTTRGAAASTDADAAPQARDYVRIAWHTILRAPLTVVWRLFGDVAALLLRPFALLWFTAVLSLGVAAGAGPGASAAEALVGLLRASPGRLFGGIAGLVAVLWLLSFVVDAIASGGVLQLLARGTLGEPVGGTRRLLEAVGEGFPKIAILRLLGAALQLVVTLVGLVVAVALVYGFTRAGFASLAWGWKTLILAVPLFLYLSLVILVRFTMRAAAAPLFLHGSSAPTAIADAAAFVLDRLASLYRLLAFVAGLLLAPLLGYWALLIVSNLVGMESAFGPLFDALQIVGQVVLFACFGVFSILFDGALFALYADDSGLIDVRGSGDDPRDSASSHSASAQFNRSTTLESLLPKEIEHRLDVRRIPGFGENDGEDGSEDP